MNEPIVRPAGLDDLATLLSFEQGLIEAERAFDPAISVGDDVRYYDLEWLIASADAEVIVAEIDAATIGCGYAFIQPSKAYLRHRFHSYLGFMYIVPEHRGKGINKMIMQALESWSAAKGVSVLQLEVYVRNEAAIRAYERSGFERNLLEMRKILS